MYIPYHFEENRLDVLCALIRTHGLAALVTSSADGLVANHIPLIWGPDPAPYGTLRGHLSKANGQWKNLVPDSMALAIFQGASAYITPSWYPEKQSTGRVVPTYNYAVVHAHGPLQTYEDPLLLAQHLRSLTMAHEAQFENQWSIDAAPPE